MGISWKEIRREISIFIQKATGNLVYGVTGWSDGTIVNSSKKNYIRVSIDGSDEEIEVFNDNVPQVKGLLVAVFTDPDDTSMRIARNVRFDPEESDFDFIINKFHASNHDGYGPDPVYIYGSQIRELRPTAKGLVLTIEAGWLQTSGGYLYFPKTNFNMAYYRPLKGMRYVLVSLTPEADIFITSGNIKIDEDLLQVDIPSAPLGHKPICIISLRAGQRKIYTSSTKSDLVDVRYISMVGVNEDVMLKSVYGGSEDGVVSSADAIKGVESASDLSFYGKNALGEIGFNELGVLVPSGGLTGQVLKKISDTSYDVEWGDAGSLSFIMVYSGAIATASLIISLTESGVSV